MTEQDQGFNGYSLFMKKVKELQESKKGNAKFMTLEEIEKSIKRLEEIDNNSRKIIWKISILQRSLNLR